MLYVLSLIKTKLTHSYRLLRSLNALNDYQINVFQPLAFVYKLNIQQSNIQQSN